MVCCVIETLSGFSGSPVGRPTLNSPPEVPTIKSRAGASQRIVLTLLAAMVYIKASPAKEVPVSKSSYIPDCEAHTV